jgi:hypothetical protein
MLYIYSTYYKQTCAKLEEHEARFEMLPALYSLAEYAFRIKNTDGSHDLNAIYDEVIKDGLSSLHNEEDIQKRIQEYRIILNGKQPRSECLLECDREESAESPVYRAVTMLCDRFVNPECTNNYFYAPAIVLENMDISYFVMDIYRPIGWEMNHLVSDFLSV